MQELWQEVEHRGECHHLSEPNRKVRYRVAALVIPVPIPFASKRLVLMENQALAESWELRRSPGHRLAHDSRIGGRVREPGEGAFPCLGGEGESQ